MSSVGTTLESSKDRGPRWGVLGGVALVGGVTIAILNNEHALEHISNMFHHGASGDELLALNDTYLDEDTANAFRAAFHEVGGFHTPNNINTPDEIVRYIDGHYTDQTRGMRDALVNLDAQLKSRGIVSPELHKYIQDLNADSAVTTEREANIAATRAGNSLLTEEQAKANVAVRVEKNGGLQVFYNYGVNREEKIRVLLEQLREQAEKAAQPGQVATLG